MKNDLFKVYVLSGIFLFLGLLVSGGIIFLCQFDYKIRQWKIRRQKRAAVRQHKTKKFQTISGSGHDHIFDHNSPYH